MSRFTCGDTKILSILKMSQNIMTRIVATAAFANNSTANIYLVLQLLHLQLQLSNLWQFCFAILEDVRLKFT